jgi:hypothetical protein
MKSNIIYLNDATSNGSALPHFTRINIPNDGQFGILDSAVALWLGAWTLVAAFAFFAV